MAEEPSQLVLLLRTTWQATMGRNKGYLGFQKMRKIEENCWT